MAEKKFVLLTNSNRLLYDVVYGSLYLKECLKLQIIEKKVKLIDVIRWHKIIGQIKKYNTIVVYGAGSIGQKIYVQLREQLKNKRIVLVDSNYKALKCHGIEANSLESVLKYQQKCFLITVNQEKIAYDIEKICLITESRKKK